MKPGYKQTEVGVIPEDWEVATIIAATHQIMDFRGRTPKKLGMDWGGGDIPALSAKNVKMGFIDFDEECYLGSDALYSKWMVHGDVAKGDVLFTTEAPLGNVALVPDDRKYILSQRTILLKANEKKITTEFLFHQLASDYFQKLLSDNSSGSTAKGIQRKKLEQLQVVLPPPSEQRAIATALSDMDALLDGLDRLIAKKRDIKQATMQQLLTGKTRLPGFSGEWEVKRLGALGATYGGLTGKTKSDFGVGAAKYITFLNVITNTVVDCLAFEKVKISDSESQNKVLCGDLIFNGSSETPEEVAFCSLMAEEIPDLYLNSFCFGFRFFDNQQVDGLFLAYYIRSNPGREMMKSLAQGSTRYNLSKAALCEASIFLPTKAEQTAIATILSDMDAELSALEARRAKTRDVKQAMMQELLTGKTRLV